MTRDQWTFISFLVFVFALVVIGLIITHAMDMEQNKTINECIRAGKDWIGNQCE